MTTARPAYGWNRSVKAVVGGMCLVTALFAASTFYDRVRLDETTHALSIAINGAPSVRLLGEVRTELRRLRTAAETLSVGRDSDARPKMLRASSRLHSLLAAELRTPEYPHERQLSDKVLGTLGMLDHSMTLLDPSNEDRVAATRRYLDFSRLADDVDDSLDQLHQLNAEGTLNDAALLLARERGALKEIFWADLFCVVVAAAITVFIVRLLRAQFLVLGRRATELEHFAVQVGHDVLNPLVPIQIALNLSRTGTHDEATERSLARAVRGIARLRRAADALLAFARAGAPPAPGQVASVRTAIELAVESSPAVKAVTVEPYDDLVVAASTAALDALLRTFLDEAVHEAGPDDIIRIAVRPSGDQVRVELQLPKQVGAALPSSQLFAPHVRDVEAGYPGIDLELEAARRIVEAHRGALGISEDGPYRVLWFQLPAATLSRAVLDNDAT